MDEMPSEELIERMTPALSELAELVSHAVHPDADTLKPILLRLGLDSDMRALHELEQWCQILSRVRSMPDDLRLREDTIEALQERGIPEAPAMLAVNRVAGKPMTCEPDALDFGVLRPGEPANATLTVRGRLKDVKPRGKRLSVALHRWKPTETLVKIMLTAGKPGESLNEAVVLRGEGVEISVPVKAHWAVEQPAVSKNPQGPQPLKVCPTCNARGIHGEGSLFWNWRDKKWECLNWKCPDFRLTDTPKGRS